MEHTAIELPDNPKLLRAHHGISPCTAACRTSLFGGRVNRRDPRGRSLRGYGTRIDIYVGTLTPLFRDRSRTHGHLLRSSFRLLLWRASAGI